MDMFIQQDFHVKIRL